MPAQPQQIGLAVGSLSVALLLFWAWNNNNKPRDNERDEDECENENHSTTTTPKRNGLYVGNGASPIKVPPTLSPPLKPVANVSPQFAARPLKRSRTAGRTLLARRNGESFDDTASLGGNRRRRRGALRRKVKLRRGNARSVVSDVSYSVDNAFHIANRLSVAQLLDGRKGPQTYQVHSRQTSAMTENVMLSRSVDYSALLSSSRLLSSSQLLRGSEAGSASPSATRSEAPVPTTVTRQGLEELLRVKLNLVLDSREEADRLFAALDRDGKGHIDTADVSYFVEQCGIHIGGDGKIHRRDYVLHLSNVAKRGPIVLAGAIVGSPANAGEGGTQLNGI